jgi:F-type H+-transporting ATPase subunit alpha
VSQAQLDRGYRLTELLKQNLNSPMPVEEQVVSLYAGTHGYLDPIPVSDVGRFETELLEWFRARNSALLDSIRSTSKVADEAAFEAAIKAFAEQFLPSEGAAAAEPGAEAQAEAERQRAGGMKEGILPEDEITRDEEQ